MCEKRQRVVVLGASPKPERYSNQAVRLLLEHGHEVVPVNPGVDAMEGLPVAHRLEDVEGHVDTLTLYVSPQVSSHMRDDIVRLRPDRVVFNPGTENATLRDALEASGVRTEETCTLVLLRTGQF